MFGIFTGGRRSLFIQAAMLTAVFIVVGSSILIVKSPYRCGPVEKVFNSLTMLSGKEPVIIVDAGHGGIDGGAQSSDGVSEKNINLAISMFIRDILEEYPVKVFLTRDGDYGLYTGVKNDGTDQMEIEGKRSIRSLKSEDLNARKDMADLLKADAFVSIHLNSFKENRQAFGAQTFYTNSCEGDIGEMSRNLAENIQSNLISQIDNENTRVALVKNDVLIMKNVQCPTVIVECGFLSNSAEAELLSDESYQKTIASAITKGILDYLGIQQDVQNSDGKSSIKIIDSRE